MWLVSVRSHVFAHYSCELLHILTPFLSLCLSKKQKTNINSTRRISSQTLILTIFRYFHVGCAFHARISFSVRVSITLSHLFQNLRHCPLSVSHRMFVLYWNYLITLPTLVFLLGRNKCTAFSNSIYIAHTHKKILDSCIDIYNYI